MPATDTPSFLVTGGNPLAGTVHVGGAKNSALKLMAASVMAPGPTTLENVPLISDVRIMEQVLETLGATVTHAPDGDPHTLLIDTSDLTSHETPYELVAQMRASISILGPLITRFGCARVAMPGGCQIGARKLDMHIASLEALGVSFGMDHGYISATTPNGLAGAEVILDFPSVGATENLMMASVCAEGVTCIRNAASEPEIADLASYLVEMGACIDGAGTPNITIIGVDELHPAARHTVVGDRIEAGTYLVAGAIGGGPVTVTGADPAHLAMAIKKLQQMGCTVVCTAPDPDIVDEQNTISATGRGGAAGRGAAPGETTAPSITVERDSALLAVDIQTLPHPGFPTDLQAQFMVLAAIAQGDSVITENVFENRFMFAAELGRMGADIRIDGHHALVSGTDHLSGAPVSSTDLRGGAALVLAGLAARGTTTVTGVHHIDRGYEDYAGKLRSLGADVTRTDAPDVARTDPAAAPAAPAAAAQSAAPEAAARS